VTGVAPKRRLLVATGSAHKLAELRALLNLSRTELLSLADAGLADDAPEEGTTFAENAVFKARWYARRAGLPTLADDSGLEVDFLGGAPGVRTRRFAGVHATDEQNNAHLLALLDGQPSTERRARYRCVLALAEQPADGHAEVMTTTGVFEGRIAASPRGSNGFGYDPIFEPSGEPVGGHTVGQMDPLTKNRISHRAQAARQMRELLIARGY
jgi:XTP/dITP diphosphohydrolase